MWWYTLPETHHYCLHYMESPSPTHLRSVWIPVHCLESFLHMDFGMYEFFKSCLLPQRGPGVPGEAVAPQKEWCHQRTQQPSSKSGTSGIIVSWKRDWCK